MSPERKQKVRTSPAAEVARPRTPLAGAAAAAANLEISNVRFTSFSALTSVGPGEAVPPRVSVRIGFTRPSIIRPESRVFIATTFLIRVMDKSQPDRLPVVDFRVATELAYEVRENTTITDSDLDEFARINAPFNAWPYWREFYQSTMFRLRLPPSPLPLFRIQDAAGLMIDDPEASQQ